MTLSQPGSAGPLVLAVESSCDETGIGIVFLHDAMIEKVAGYPMEMVVPEEGTGYETGGLSIIHGARHLDAAKAFVDWALSKEAQELADRAHCYQWPSNKSATPPARATSTATRSLLACPSISASPRRLPYRLIQEPTRRR